MPILPLRTVLISILSNDYALISQNSSEEKCFQAAISTVGGVKSDAIFSYIIRQSIALACHPRTMYPFAHLDPSSFTPSSALNIPAALILGPLSFVLTPRAFHRVNVFLIRISVRVKLNLFLNT